MFKQDLNTLKVFAFALDKLGKLSRQLLLDTTSRLLIILKCRYLDYCDKSRLDMSQLEFESVRKFIVHEIAAEYAQAFFISLPVPRIFEYIKWAVEIGTRALLGALLMLPEPVYIKLVLLSPLMVLMINLNCRLYALCVPNLTLSIF